MLSLYYALVMNSQDMRLRKKDRIGKGFYIALLNHAYTAVLHGCSAALLVGVYSAEKL